jgi:predicted permease
MAVDPGFQMEDRAAVEIILPKEKYPEIDDIRRFLGQVEERVANLPGVRSYGLTSTLPLFIGNAITLGFVEEGKEVDLANVPSGGFDMVTPGYLETLEVPLVKGRLLDDRDHADAVQTVVVSEALVRRYWPDEEPLGKRLQIRDPEGPWVEIVGVVGDVHHQGLNKEPRAAMYQPVSQMALDWRESHIVAHVEPGQKAAVIAALRQAVRTLDPNQATEVRTLEGLASESVRRQRFQMVVLVLFATVALLLGSLGIYGVVSYTVHQSRREIGIRGALGADRGTIFGWVARRGLVPVAVGIVAGLVGSFFAGRAMESFLFEVRPSDPLTLVSITALVLVVASLAIALPARRATRVDPMVVLREE